VSYLIFFLTGLFAGVIGGLLGLGGCVLMMPMIRFGFHFDPAIAVGTTLTAVVFTAVSGSYQHVKMKNVDKNTAQIIAISGVFGVIIGSFVFSYIKEFGAIIDLLLGIIFFIVSVRMIFEGFCVRGFQSLEGSTILGKKMTKSILGSFIGFLTGAVGLGGGYILVPSFVLLRAPLQLAIGTSMVSFVWIVLAGAMFKIYQGVVNLPVALTLGIGAFIGAIYGARLVSKFKSNRLKAMFGLLFAYVSLKYILIYFKIYI
jgi:hypothetical protein